MRGGRSIEIWDGYFADGTLAGRDLVRGEPIPEGIYHMVCEVLVRHVDGDYLLMQRDFGKPNFGGWFDATAGGSALKGEDKTACARRELLEETGILAGRLKEIGHCVSKNTIYYNFLCVTDCGKNSVTLQPGETVAFWWISEKEFAAFIHSGRMIAPQKNRYRNYFINVGYLPG